MSCCENSQNNSALALETQIGVGVTSVIARSDGGKWRFFIQSDKMVLVKIVQDSPLGRLQSKRQYCAPNSAIEIQGRDPVIIECENLDTENTATVQTWNANYLDAGLEPVEYAEEQLTADNATFSNLGSFGGYPAPYCNHCRIYVDAGLQTRLIAYDAKGQIVFQSGPQPVDERLYIDLDTPQGYQWKINKTTTGSVNYTVIWYRE